MIPLFITMFAGKSFAGDIYKCSFTYLEKDQAGINVEEIKIEAAEGPNRVTVPVPELNKMLRIHINKLKDDSRKGSHDVHVTLFDKNSKNDPWQEITLVDSLSNKSKYIYLSSHIYGTSYAFQCEKQP